ncbi:MAG: peptidoglycan binding domain-containing protein, partial [Anaerolineales bacterium]
MSTVANYPYRTNRTPPSPLHKTFAILAGGAVVAATLFIVVYITLSIAFLGKVFPGILVNGVDVGGLTRNEALQALQSQITYPDTGLIVFEDQQNMWTYSPKELGLFIDYSATVDKAFQVGRRGWPWQRFGGRLQLLSQDNNLSPVLILDERAARQQLAIIEGVVNQPVKDASIRLEG